MTFKSGTKQTLDVVKRQEVSSWMMVINLLFCGYMLVSMAIFMFYNLYLTIIELAMYVCIYVRVRILMNR